jgi:hypothetical protein
MNIYEHPKHGFHIISPGDDVALMVSNGWFKSTHPSERKHEEETRQETPEEVLKPRRGRPPKVKE